MANSNGGQDTWSEWDGENRNYMAGALAATAVAAGVVMYMIRRRQQHDSVAELPSRAGGLALAAVGDERLAAGRELFVEKVLPEFKPALLALIREVEDVVDHAFRRAEHAIKDL